MAARLPRLKEFVFRYEAPIDQLKTQLHRFLSSFSGLKLLSVLLEWTYDIPDPSCFLNTHAQTLEVLVYEARACPRMTFEQDTSVPIGLSMGSLGGLYSPLYTILTSCPTLQELSVPMSWDSLSPYAVTSISHVRCDAAMLTFAL